MRFLRPYKGLFWFGFFLTVLLAVFNPLRVVMIERALGEPIQQGDVSALRMWIMLIIGSIVAQTVISYYHTLATNQVAQNVMLDLRQQVFGHLLGLRIRYFDKNAVGSLHTRTISDIETLNNLFSQGFVQIFGQLLELVAIAGFMFWVDWRLALSVLAISPLMVVASRVFQIKVRASFQRVRQYVAALNAFTQEHISGMMVTQVFNREKAEYQKFENLNARHRKAHLETVLYYSVFFPVIEFVASLWLALMVWYGSLLVLGETLELRVLIAFILFSSLFFRPIRMLAERFNELQYGIVSGGRLFEVLDTQEFIPDFGNPANDRFLQKKRVAVDFERVSFAYTEDHWVLREVSFKVAPGTTTAIVGATGSGKSTIIGTLMRFYEVQQGRILVDGRPLEAYSLNGLRAAMCLVQQDVFLFNGSIFENITLFNPDITLGAVLAAATQVGAHEFITRLPGGYDFRVGERGQSLSSGQRQLIAFVRVMVYDPSVLLLDEATSNVDTETELAVQQAIANVLHGRTSIIVAHRLSTIQRADQILVMKKGEIVERGTHQELLAQGGHYKKLYLLQYGAQEPVG